MVQTLVLGVHSVAVGSLTVAAIAYCSWAVLPTCVTQEGSALSCVLSRCSVASAEGNAVVMQCQLLSRVSLQSRELSFHTLEKRKQEIRFVYIFKYSITEKF